MNRWPTRRKPRPFAPTIADVVENVQQFARLPSLLDNHVPRIEDEMDDDHYVVRAEIPGVDPDSDLHVTVRDGVLMIEAHRLDKRSGKARSEFRYGSFARTVTLPPGANDEDISATYDNGILTVSVGMDQPESQGQRIPVASGRTAMSS